MRIVKLTEKTKKNILKNLLKRNLNQHSAYEADVNEIIENVKQKGDAALFEYTEKFDEACLTSKTLQVQEEEIEEAYQLVNEKFLDVMRKALINIRSYHEKQRQNSWFHSEENG
ncbi:MAG: histidinol dehydrogenase, partial [Lachnospiraceae bacterium]|nr:histidinol dehydrogenase [Lachnospiraceae bacterium]